MKDYIEREAACELLAMALDDDWEPEYAADRMNEIPAADVWPVVRGEWLEENTRPKSALFYCSVCCSVCHQTAYDPQPTRSKEWVKRCRYAYCPNCGAYMRGEKN